MIIVTKEVHIKESTISFETSPDEISLLRLVLCKIFRQKIRFCFIDIKKLNLVEKK